MLDTQLLLAAAQGGHITTLEWLIGQGCSTTRDLCAAAARCGHLPMLEWMKQCQFPEKFRFTERVSSYAAIGGHLEVVKRLKEKAACPSDSRVITHFAENGDIQSLQ